MMMILPVRLPRIFAIAICAGVLAAASPGIVRAPAQSHQGMTFSGATGLYSIPSGKIGWDKTGSMGLDFGYSLIISEGHSSHIPKLALSFFDLLEVSAAYDVQPDNRGNDFLGGLKLQLPLSRTALALGGNVQVITTAPGEKDYTAGQIYAAVTWAGQFLDMPAETTIVLGKTFIENRSDSNIDFGMGFDMALFPKLFEGLVHWITDFSNFSYSTDAFGADAWHRGLINSGLRLNLSKIPAFNKFRFNIDVLIANAFDDNRGFSTGVTFGIPLR
jgi:hypothetical protein